MGRERRQGLERRGKGICSPWASLKVVIFGFGIFTLGACGEEQVEINILLQPKLKSPKLVSCNESLLVTFKNPLYGSFPSFWRLG